MIEVVWFKRDLRIIDHAPLLEASRRGPVLPLYIIEPSLLAAEDYDPSHWTFTSACLRELREAFALIGQPLVVRVGEALQVLQQLHDEHRFSRIWSHEETGNAITYQRDIAVGRWARANGIEWNETPNGGVIRRLKTRNGWAQKWEARMAAPVIETPTHLPRIPIEPGPIFTLRDLNLGTDRRTGAQPGGIKAAHNLLDSFLEHRGHRYHYEMSSPLTAEESCSRLSPYFAYGTISTRTVVHKLRSHIASTTDPTQRRALSAFDARLHWRDHFMQKLEDEPAIEYHNFVRGFDGMRENDHNPERFAAWAEGRTGYPMIDACMRCLHETGWINFRMRAMLVSFAAYHLWLHWRPVGLHLAKLFVDYEPGIHWSQCQMQSGTTGINTLRIYNPIKQAEDHDPQGLFISRWILEVEDYPSPIVEHKEAVREARSKLSEFRRRFDVRTGIGKVAKKHGSRKKTAARSKPKTSKQQSLLPF